MSTQRIMLRTALFTTLTVISSACGGGHSTSGTDNTGASNASGGNGGAGGQGGGSTTSVTTGTVTCPADCNGLSCGPDPVCGTSCGDCPPGETCSGGTCICVPDCSGQTCGPDPKCGTSCGDCPPGDTCSNGTCSCVPECGGMQCGNDPHCGTSCGSCPPGDTCSNGTCTCVPECGGMQCGNDPHCGTSCGSCPTGETCSNGTCKAETTATLCWNVQDECLNGQTIGFRLYDVSKNWVWPNSTQQWNLAGGQSGQECISCTPGDEICFGGTDSSQNLYWGVGLFDTSTCASCCFKCEDQTVGLGALTCN